MRAFYTLVGILLLAILASLLTEATLAVGHHGRIVDNSVIHITPLASKSPTPTPSVSSTPTPVPTINPTPTPTPQVPTATTNGYVNLRAGASTGTASLAYLSPGSVVTLGVYRDSQWQQVTYNGINGYIYRSYLNY